jgi:ABC-type antimicrobial peptide transport system permease subunit
MNFRSEIVKFEVLTAVTLQITVFWDGMLCNLQMKAADFSRRSIYMYQTKWRHIPEDSYFCFEDCFHRHWGLKRGRHFRFMETVSLLNPSSNYMYHLLENKKLGFATQCIYVFRMILGIISDYFAVQSSIKTVFSLVQNCIFIVM